MKLEDLMDRYNIENSSLDIITECMVTGKSLAETELELNGSVTQTQIFAVAKYICESEFMLPLDEMAPRFAMDRMEITEKNKDIILKKIKLAKENKKNQELMEDLLLLEIEKKAKMVA